MLRRAPEAITCKELVELVTDYLDGNLTKADEARFERHLHECDGCYTYLEQIRQTIKVTGAIREENVDAAARQKLLAAFRDWSMPGH